MSTPTSTVRVLGIDPGSRVTGYGCVDVAGSRCRAVAFGKIAIGDAPLPQRLLHIFEELGKLLDQLQPGEIAIENVFVRRNAASALVLGQARGAAICACAGRGLALFEYAPAQVKLAIVGRGRAEKQQIQHMVRALLSLPKAPAADAADALAVALCHAHHRTAPIARIAARLGVGV